MFRNKEINWALGLGTILAFSPAELIVSDLIRGEDVVFKQQPTMLSCLNSLRAELPYGQTAFGVPGLEVKRCQPSIKQIRAYLNIQ